MKMNLYGYFGGLMGYNIHTCGINEGCVENGIDVKSVTYNEMLNRTIKSRVVQNSIMKDFHDDAPSVCISYPNDMYRFHGTRRIGYTLWESTKLPPKWIKPLNSVDELWTCSQFCKKIFEDNGIDKKISVVREGVDTTIFNKFVEPMKKPNEDAFIFGSVFRWEHRKSPDILLKAFTEEFDEGENVYLAMQCANPAIKLAGIWQDIALMGLNPKMLNKVAMIADELIPQETVAKFLRMLNCFVLPTKSEAWGLPTNEAMACGVPVITTNYGGSLEFASNDVGWLIDVDHMEMPLTGYVGYTEEIPGNEWAVPSLKHLKELMRYAFEHRDECKKKGNKAYDVVENGFTWKKSTEVVKELLK